MNRRMAIDVTRRVVLMLAALSMMTTPSIALEVSLVAKAMVPDKGMPDGASVAMWGFAEDVGGGEVPTVPGPRIEIPPGDTSLTINLRNELGVPVSIVIPGQVSSLAPVTTTDGQGRTRVVSFTHETAAGGGTGTYTWTNLKPGSHLYHSGTNPAVQVQMGLYGAVTQDAAAGEAYAGISYDREVLLFYSEVDPDLNARTGGGKPTIDYKPEYFLINGEPFDGSPPAIAPSNVGETVLLRFLSASLRTHVPVLQDSHLDLIAEDGNPYPYPRRHYSVLLPAMKTLDALWSPSEPRAYTIWDRSLHLTTGGLPNGGMRAELVVASGVGVPVANDDSLTVGEGGTQTLLDTSETSVLANDSGGPPLSAVLVTAPGNGALTLNADGTFSYDHDGSEGSADAFSYVADDGTSSSNVATVAISVTPANDSPDAVDDGFTVAIGSSGNVLDVLANDTDPDAGDTLTITAVTVPDQGGSVANNGTELVYAPAALYEGLETFSYTADDSQGGVATATVSVTVVAAVNTPPLAVDDFAETVRDAPVTIDLAANDVDDDGAIDPTTVAIVDNPSRGGSVVNHLNGTVTFTPKKKFRGTDTFTYTVQDDEGETSNQATVRVNVVKP